MIPMMKKEGYHVDYAVNVTTHASLVGALMPTSHNMIIYSLAAGGKVSREPGPGRPQKRVPGPARWKEPEP